MKLDPIAEEAIAQITVGAGIAVVALVAILIAAAPALLA